MSDPATQWPREPNDEELRQIARDASTRPFDSGQVVAGLPAVYQLPQPDSIQRRALYDAGFRAGRLSVTPQAADDVAEIITDEVVERMARALYARTQEARAGFTWPINGDWGRRRDLVDARKLLHYILGNPQQPKQASE